MTRLSDPHPAFAASLEDREILRASGLLDEAGYRAAAGLPADADAVAHYLEQGWWQAIEPREGFDGEFLRPYYEASGHYGPPALTWIELSAMPGRPAPRNQTEAQGFADWVRANPFFDAAGYSAQIGGNLDPAMHYALIGELLGLAPSPLFDPAFYMERYEDLAAHSLSPLQHYTESGQRENRRGTSAASRLAFPPLPQSEKPTILVVVHDASRTGAPVLGWNIVLGLADNYDIVTLVMHEGSLEEDFRQVSAATIGPLVWEEWHAVDMKRLAARLVATYQPIYAIANSIETYLTVPALARLGVPSVALVHEFAGYTRPLAKMRDVFDWATHIVFPADLVANASFDAFPALAQRRGIHVLSQGRSQLPDNGGVDATADILDDSDADISRHIQPDDADDCFVVIGIGSVHIRKGVDLFLTAAAFAKKISPDQRFRFVWIGDGYDPINDASYSVYLAEQLARSTLTETVIILDPIANLEPVYAAADMFFLSSRLDPQPNVGIDAVTRGIPTVCFDNACGTAEILSADTETRSLVVPYLDTYRAAAVICELARDRAALAEMGRASARVGNAAYDMRLYLKQIDKWGRSAAAALKQEDLQTLINADVIDPELALPPLALPTGAFGVERHVLQQWAVVGTSHNQVSNPQFRRPCPGFHPQVYAQHHADACIEGGANPLAHWLRNGKPKGAWSRQVFTPLDALPGNPETVRVALHAHFYYLDNAPDFAARLACNETRTDLFISTNTDAKAEALRAVFTGHGGAVEVRVMPNRGRDIGPFLVGFAPEIARGGYDVVGHFHGKKSLSTNEAMGDLWREFLWDNLIGGEHRMLDLAAAAFASQPELGLVIAEDPHLVGWDENKPIAEALAARMGMTTPLDDFFDFPLGTMFWARPAALQPLVDLGLTWDDYPGEPVAYDGTLLHALERLLPHATHKAKLAMAGMRAPGTTW